MKMKYIH